MLTTELKTLFESLVDDTLTSDLEIQLLDNAKVELENERDWEYLKTWATLVLTSGETTSYDLPSDFNNMLQLTVEDISLTREVSIQKKHAIDGNSHGYYFDYNNETITFGAVTAEAPELCYIKYTPTLTDSTSPLFPARFHSVLAYKAAQMFFAIDGGEKARAWDDRWTIYMNELLGSMRLWDSRLKQKTIDNTNDYSNGSGIGIGLN